MNDTSIQNPPQKSGPGCLGIGCAILAALLVLGLLAAGIGGWSLYQTAKGYTSETQEQITVVEPAPGEYEAVIGKVAAFEAAVAAGETPSLTLSAREFNTFMIGSPEDAEVRKVLAYSIEDGQLFVTGSFPLDTVPFFKGRFFNGKIGLRIVNSASGVEVFMSSFSADGKALPDDVMKGASTENMIAELTAADGHLGSLLSRTEAVEVVNNSLLFQGRMPGSSVPEVESTPMP